MLRHNNELTYEDLFERSICLSEDGEFTVVVPTDVSGQCIKELLINHSFISMQNLQIFIANPSYPLKETVTFYSSKSRMPDKNY